MPGVERSDHHARSIHTNKYRGNNGLMRFAGRSNIFLPGAGICRLATYHTDVGRDSQAKMT
jgi:hypothetical protein